MSTSSAPISIASATSLIRSPAPVPTMPRPQCDGSGRQTAAWKPSDRPLAKARPDAPQGRALLDRHTLRLGLLLGQAHPGNFRVGIGHTRNDASIKFGASQCVISQQFAGNDFGRNVPFMHSLQEPAWAAPRCRQWHRCCPRWVRCCRSTAMKPRSFTRTPALSAPHLAPIGRASHGLQDKVIDLGLGLGLTGINRIEAHFNAIGHGTGAHPFGY